MSIKDQIDALEVRRRKADNETNKISQYSFLVFAIIVVLTFLISHDVIQSLIIGLTISLPIFALVFSSSGSSAKLLNHEFKYTILKEYMSIYHPGITYTYGKNNRVGSKIINQSQFYQSTNLEESDIISGRSGPHEFYISQIQPEKGKSSSFKAFFTGILVSIRIKDKNFSESRIQSNATYKPKMYKGWLLNEEYDLRYETDEHDKFQSELSQLFPFIAHMLNNYRNLKIHTKKERITLYLDTPKGYFDNQMLGITKSFKNKSLNNNLAKQLNSIFFILDSLSNDFTKTQIEETLELKMIEWEKLNNER